MKDIYQLVPTQYLWSIVQHYYLSHGKGKNYSDGCLDAQTISSYARNITSNRGEIHQRNSKI